MEPDPITLVSLFSGLPEYRISPEPFTLAFKLLVAFTFASPDPETYTWVFCELNEEPLKSPLTLIFISKYCVLPESSKSPEPVNFSSIVLASRSKLISPYPVRETS